MISSSYLKPADGKYVLSTKQSNLNSFTLLVNSGQVMDLGPKFAHLASVLELGYTASQPGATFFVEKPCK